MAQLAYKWKVMITVVFGVWMIVLDSTVVNVAFPTVRRAFSAGIDDAQWVISVYVLALGIATPLAGFISDQFGLKRVYLGTLAGAITIFVWGAISHMVLLEGIGFSRMPNEDRIVSTLRISLNEDGLYFFPNIDLRGHPSAEDRAAWEAKFRAGPTGMIIYHPAGDRPVSPKKLFLQFLSCVIAASIVAYVLFASAGTYSRRVGIAVLLGIFGLFTVSTIYWNWYGFPNAFFLAQGVDMIVGWALAGAVIARLIPIEQSAS
jgi:hypothetical protein